MAVLEKAGQRVQLYENDDRDSTFLSFRQYLETIWPVAWPPPAILGSPAFHWTSSGFGEW